MDKKEFFLNSGPDNPRNSEGAFITLKDGSIMFAYTRYRGDSWADEANADIAVCYSGDGGINWSDSVVMIPNNRVKGNLMSVSLLRLHDGRIGMLYLAKEYGVPGEPLCTPIFRYSEDEAKSWSCEQRLTVFPVWSVVNNDRMIQLKSGRLMVPVAYTALAKTPNGEIPRPALSSVIYSDDGGRSWHENAGYVYAPQNSCTGLQEPGVIELESGRLMMWARTDLYCQYRCFSEDGGNNWSEALPFKGFACTVTPLSIKRDPWSGALVAIWADGNPRWGIAANPENSWDRTPLVKAISYDDGKSWQNQSMLENNPERGFCYTAIHFTEKSVLLAYCCGGYGKAPLQDAKIVCIDRDKFFKESKI